MAQIIQERVINGSTWKVSQFPATRGWRIFTKLSKTILPALGQLVGSVKDWDNLDVDGDGLSKAIMNLVVELDADKSEPLIKELLSLTWCDGKEVVPQFDTLFQANYGTLMKVLSFVVEANYRSFLPDALIQRVGLLKEKVKD